MEYLPSITNNFTKTQLNIVAEGYLETISANGKVLELADLISKMEYFIDVLRKNPSFVEEVRTELSKYGNKFTTETTKIELAETGVKYDYSHTNCSQLFELEKIKETIESQISDVKEFLKALPDSGMVSVNKETGELEHLFPPIRTSKSSFKTTISK